jgi:hypothetical protein
MALISDADKALKPEAQSSSPTHTAAGSGSRPTPSRFKIADSAPTEPHTLGRDVAGSLK